MMWVKKYLKKPSKSVYLSTIIALMFLTSFFILLRTARSQISISNVKITDINGKQRDAFSKGTSIFVESTISCHSVEPLKYVLIIQITDPEGYVVSTNIVKDEMITGLKTLGLSYLIPPEAIDGEYRVEIFLWNSLPIQENWKPSSTPIETTFRVG